MRFCRTTADKQITVGPSSGGPTTLEVPMNDRIEKALEGVLDRDWEKRQAEYAELADYNNDGISAAYYEVGWLHSCQLEPGREKEREASAVLLLMNGIRNGYGLEELLEKNATAHWLYNTFLPERTKARLLAWRPGGGLVADQIENILKEGNDE
jgi:hypothetical protein